MKPSTVVALKSLPFYSVLDRVRDWHSMNQMKRRGTFSQHGEDLFVLEYFNHRPGFYIDIGANHPFRISNTYLLYLNGWRGITIEPIPHLSRKHRQYRPNDLHFNVGAGSCDATMRFYELSPNLLSTFNRELAAEYIKTHHAVQTGCRDIPVRTLASLWKELGVREKVAFLTIDCEGHDLEVLRGIDWSATKPQLVAVETVHEHAADETGQLLSPIGYKFLATRGYNTFFELASH